jgi:tetratricopeptide (TPR) repeat protein
VNLLGNGIQSVYARLNSAMLYWRLGRPRQAEQSLSEAQALLNRNPNQGSLSLLNLRKAEIDYRSGRFEEAKANARKISAVAQANSDPGLSLILALIAIRTNQKAQGIRAATNLIEESDRDKLAGSAASARLAVAEALVMTGDRSLALKMALEALAFFEPRHIWEGTWRAHVVAARCLDENAAEEQLFAARSAIAELRKIWSSGSVDLYLERPDIKALRKSAAF